MVLIRRSAVVLLLLFVASPMLLAASDDKPAEVAANEEVPYGTRQYLVGRSEDDAEEGVDGQVDLANEDLDLGQLAGFESAKAIGIRFEGIHIPEGHEIANAFLQFTAEGFRKKSKATELTIRAELAGNAASFEQEAKNISSRKLTETSVIWSPEPWNPDDGRGEHQRTPDLSVLIREVVGQDGWKQGNAVVFVLTGDGERDAMSFDGGGKEQGPTLQLETNLPAL